MNGKVSIFTMRINQLKKYDMKEQTLPNKATISLDDNQVLTMKMLPKSDINANDATKICEIASQLSGSTIHGNLVDISEMTFMDKAARQVFSSQNKGTVPAVAIVSNSIIHKSIVNMYFTFSKPIIPTKAFDSREKAYEWLVSMIKDGKK